MNSRLTCYVTDPIVHNEFLITTYLHWKGKRFLLTSAYLKHSGHGMDVFTDQLHNLEVALKTYLLPGDILVMGTDANCKVGGALCAEECSVIGEYGGADRDARGEVFLRMCIRNGWCIRNTFQSMPRQEQFTCWSLGGTSFIDSIVTNKPSIFQSCTSEAIPVKPTNHKCVRAEIVLESPKPRSERKPIAWSPQDLANYLCEVEQRVQSNMTLEQFGIALREAAVLSGSTPKSGKQSTKEQQLVINTLKKLWRKKNDVDKKRVLGRFISIELGKLSKLAAQKKAQNILQNHAKGGWGKKSYKPSCKVSLRDGAGQQIISEELIS